MRKIFTIIFAAAAIMFVGSASAIACGDACNDSSDCANAGTCRLCLDGTCQHRCAADDKKDSKFNFLAAQCGDACNDSSDCTNAGTCRLCLDGTCQHRCAADETNPFPVKAAACNDACNDSSDCANAGTCRLCLDGTCQHRCASFENKGNPDCLSYTTNQ